MITYDGLHLEDDAILANRDVTSPITLVAAPEDETVLREVRKYRTHEIEDVHEHDEYREFLEKALKPLGLYSADFLPSSASSCYKVTFRDEAVAIFRLTPVAPDSVFHRTIPGASGKKILQVNNVAVEQTYQGDLLLGIILKNCALLSHAKGFDFVAGLVRHEVLPLFVDFGTLPVRHEPLHLLGDSAICDYVTYFRTDRREHIDYALARSYHYFHRKVTMKRIAADVKRSALRATDEFGSV
ncbi:hypothetical protein GCM10023195_06540 [Actinoallomurus liliacearum]|uniref:GNAT family N-acetyltransferase n=1 Tax=Actinoallomurus liliacearum TaxID=1080073 RepID=A0ABP8TA33_9ACTN